MSPNEGYNVNLPTGPDLLAMPGFTPQPQPQPTAMGQNPIPGGTAGPGFGFDSTFSTNINRSQIMKPTSKIDMPIGGVKGPLTTGTTAKAPPRIAQGMTIGGGKPSTTGFAGNTKRAMIYRTIREIFGQIKRGENITFDPLGAGASALPTNATPLNPLDTPKLPDGALGLPKAPAPTALSEALSGSKPTAVSPVPNRGVVDSNPFTNPADQIKLPQNPDGTPDYTAAISPERKDQLGIPNLSSPPSAVPATFLGAGLPKLPVEEEGPKSRLMDSIRRRQMEGRYPQLKGPGDPGYDTMKLLNDNTPTVTPLTAATMMAGGPLARGVGMAGRWGLSKLLPGLVGGAAPAASTALGTAGAAAPAAATAAPAAAAAVPAAARGLFGRGVDAAKGFAKDRLNIADLGARVPFTGKVLPGSAAPGAVTSSLPGMLGAGTVRTGAGLFSPLTTGLAAARAIPGNNPVSWLVRAAGNLAQKATALPRAVAGEPFAAGVAKTVTGQPLAGVAQTVASAAAPALTLSLLRPGDKLKPDPSNPNQASNPYIDRATGAYAGVSAAGKSGDPTKLLSVPLDRLGDTSDRMLDRWLRPTEQKFTQLREDGRSLVGAGLSAAVNTAGNVSNLARTAIFNSVDSSGRSTIDSANMAVNEELDRQNMSSGKNQLATYSPKRFSGSPVYDSIKGMLGENLGTPEEQAVKAMQGEFERSGIGKDFEDKLLRGDFAEAAAQKDSVQSWIKSRQPPDVPGGLKFDDPTKKMIPMTESDFGPALKGATPEERKIEFQKLLDRDTPPDQKGVFESMGEKQKAYRDAAAFAAANPGNAEASLAVEKAKLASKMALNKFNDRSLATYERDVLPKVKERAGQLAGDIPKAVETLKQLGQIQDPSQITPEQQQSLQKAQQTIQEARKVVGDVESYAVRSANQIDPKIKDAQTLIEEVDKREVVLGPDGKPIQDQFGNVFKKPTSPAAKQLEAIAARETIQVLGKPSPDVVNSIVSTASPLEKNLLYAGLGLVAVGVLSGALGGGQLSALLGLLGVGGLGAVVGGAFSPGGFKLDNLTNIGKWKDMAGGLFNPGAVGQAQAIKLPQNDPGLFDVEDIKGTKEFQSAISGKMPTEQAAAIFGRIRPDQREAVGKMIADPATKAFYYRISQLDESGRPRATTSGGTTPSNVKVNLQPDVFNRGLAVLQRPDVMTNPENAFKHPESRAVILSVAKLDPTSRAEVLRDSMPVEVARAFVDKLTKDKQGNELPPDRLKAELEGKMNMDRRFNRGEYFQDLTSTQMLELLSAIRARAAGQ